jgi:hypothetical protein
MDSSDLTIDDDEFILRRIPVSTRWYDPGVGPQPAADAFRPHPQNDADGLSVSREASPAHPEFLNSAQVASRGRSADGYHVAVLRVSDLRQHGIRVMPAAQDDDPGHSLLPDINSANRKTDRVAELKQLLANTLTLRVDGPFPGRPGH